jgi:hypothetical protein
MGLIDDIKSQAKKAGTNRGKLIYFKPGAKVRFRFRQDMEEGTKVLFHDSFSLGINVPCQKLFGRKCRYCDNDDLRHRDLYVWSVYDYEAKEDKLLLGAVNNFSPIPALVGMYETYGTLTDRDYVITKNGTQTSTTFSVVPMDKVKFRNEKSKPFSESKLLGILDKAFPSEDSDADEDEEEDVKPAKKKSKPSDADDEDETPKKKTNKKPVEEDEDETTDYEEMTAKELYKLCIKRDIPVKPKKSESFYIAKLKDYDEETNSDEDEDDWD